MALIYWVPISNIPRQFGKTVRRRRTAAVLSQENLAERAGLHLTYISMVERGSKNPTLDVAMRISRTLRVPLPHLIEETQSRRNLGKDSKSK